MSEFLTSKDFEKFIKENDARFLEHGRRIADLNIVREDAKDLRKQIADTKTDLSKLCDSCVDNSECVGVAFTDQDAKQAKIMQQLDALAAALESNKAAQEQVKSSQLQSRTAIRESLDKISDINMQLISLAPLKRDVEASKEEVKNFKQSVLAQIEAYRVQMTNLLNEIKSLKEEVAGLIDVNADLLSDKKDTLDALKALHEKTDEISRVIELKINSSVFSLKKEIADKIADIQIPDIKDLAAASRVAKIESQLEGISLDAKNAMLKSGNVDMQNQLNVKKLENIQLLLKQHELMK